MWRPPGVGKTELRWRLMSMKILQIRVFVFGEFEYECESVARTTRTTIVIIVLTVWSSPLRTIPLSFV